MKTFNCLTTKGYRGKYRNIKLVSSSDVDYRNYVSDIIAEKRSQLPDDYIQQEVNPLTKVSRDVEYIVRRQFGSDPVRILQYDVMYQGSYQRHYRELDILKNIEKDDSVLVGEIKASSSNSPHKASLQLQRSCEILSEIYPSVTALIINVDMADDQAESQIEPESLEMINRKGFAFTHILMSLSKVLEYADEEDLSYNKEMMIAACEEAKICAQNRMEKNYRKFLRKLERQANEPVSAPVSSFGILLQNALMNSYHREIA